MFGQDMNGSWPMLRRLFIRAAGYAISMAVAWLVYIGGIAAEIPGPGSVAQRLLAASIFSLIGGFAAALALMAPSWILSMWIYLRFRLSGPVFFIVTATILMVILGCISSSLSWKPLFIEDQTFLEGFVIALKRQGMILAAAGAAAGLGYWHLAEKFIKCPRRDTLEARG